MMASGKARAPPGSCSFRWAGVQEHSVLCSTGRQGKPMPFTSKEFNTTFDKWQEWHLIFFGR